MDAHALMDGQLPHNRQLAAPCVDGGGFPFFLGAIVHWCIGACFEAFGKHFDLCRLGKATLTDDAPMIGGMGCVQLDEGIPKALAGLSIRL